jgi:hypothetical protein
MVERTICSCRNGTESNSAKNGDDEEFGEHLDGKESKMRRIYDGNKMEMGCEYGDRLVKDEDWMRTGVQWEWVRTKYPMFLLYTCRRHCLRVFDSCSEAQTALSDKGLNCFQLHNPWCSA